jgi:dihydroorotate dehydrogenase electron transfer subunit
LAAFFAVAASGASVDECSGSFFCTQFYYYNVLMNTKEKTHHAKGIFWASVLENQRIKECYYRLILELEHSATDSFCSVAAGQFAMLDLTQTSLPAPEHIADNLKDAAKRQIILRRPFSFSDVSVYNGSEGKTVRLSIMYCVLGPSTVRMTQLSGGDKISVLGPLGNGFQMPQKKDAAILIAGGMGSPPIIHLAGILKSRFPEMKTVVFAGAKDYESMPFTIEINNKTGPVAQEFQQLNVNHFFSTDNGSLGFKGYVTNAVENWLIKNPLEAQKAIIYACGPEVMLAATARLAGKYNIEYRLCCQDGPVFDARKVVFGGEG